MVLSRKIKFVFLFSLFVTGIFFLYANFVSSSNPDYRVGFETSMRKVFIKNDIQPFQGEWTDQVNNQWSISLAKNEYESFQIVVKANKDLQNVEITSSNLENLGIEIHPIGYFETREPSGYDKEKRPNGFGYPLGWYPDVIMRWTSSVNIKNGDYQPFWVTVYAPKNIGAGDKQIKLRIKADNSASKSLTINVHIYGFTIPDKPSLKTAWSWGLGDTDAIYKNSQAWGQRKKQERHIFLDEFEYLIEKYRFWPDRIYTLGPPYMKELYSKYGFIDDTNFVAGSVGLTKDCGASSRKKKELGLPADASDDDYVEAFTEDVKRRWSDVPNKMKPYFYLYFFDEVHKECYGKGKELLRKIREKLNEKGVHIKIHITSFCDQLVGNMTDTEFLSYIDQLSGCGGFILMADNDNGWANTRIEWLRKNHVEVWPYTAGGNYKNLAWFIENPLINGRALLGYRAYFGKWDGFLYWEVGDWFWKDDTHTYAVNTHPLGFDGDGYIRDWNPWSCRFCGGNGISSLFWPGPQRIAASIRLANIRDGLEDYEYFKILECLTGKRVHQDKDKLFTKENYVQKPEEIYKKRNEIAKEIESLGGNASRCRGPFSKMSSSYCGDGSCNNGETCSTCSADCGACPTPHYSPDINQDGKTNIQDLGILLSHWGKTDKRRYDINQDGKTDSNDADILLLTI